jgi:hypothetical protein
MKWHTIVAAIVFLAVGYYVGKNYPSVLSGVPFLGS